MRQIPKFSSVQEFITSSICREEYDIKQQFDEDLWCSHLESLYLGEEKTRRKDKNYYKKILEEIKSLNGSDPLLNFLQYKGLPEFCDFDCDGTITQDGYKQGYYSWFVREIYRILWNWNDLDVHHDLSCKYENQIIRKFATSVYGDLMMGPDTMNSFWITFSAYLVNNFPDAYKWNPYKNTFLFKQKENGNQIERALKLKEMIEIGEEQRIVEDIRLFSLLTHTIGNMILVPARYNGYRGTQDFLKDYFDLSLDNLVKPRDGNVYFGNVDDTREEKYVKYVNVFFLWDYVDENYRVLPLCESHIEWMKGTGKDVENVLPHPKKESELCKKINRLIRRRSVFMIAMLEIAIGDNSYSKLHEHTGWNVSDNYRRIVEKVFMNSTKRYKGYEDVFLAIKNVLYEEKDLLEKLNCYEEMINKI